MSARPYTPLRWTKSIRYILRRGALSGYCPICGRRTLFIKRGSWLRDDLLCIHCQSIPRFRAIIHVLATHLPDWRELTIHESSPGGAASGKLAAECPAYIPTHLLPGVQKGTVQDGIRCEDLERQTFSDSSLDLVVTQDVVEHLLDPARAFSEIARTLKPGGAHVFTVPWYFWKPTRIRAVREGDEIVHIDQPDYHDNPIDPAGSLVAREWGWDLCDFVYRSSGLTTSVLRTIDRRLGIDGDFIEVFVSRKSPKSRERPETAVRQL